MIIAFDVEGTILKDAPNDNEVRTEIIEMLKVLSRFHNILLWSYNGAEKARDVGKRFDLEPYLKGYCRKYKTTLVDLAFDDMVSMDNAVVNVRV